VAEFLVLTHYRVIDSTTLDREKPAPIMAKAYFWQHSLPDNITPYTGKVGPRNDLFVLLETRWIRDKYFIRLSTVAV